MPNAPLRSVRARAGDWKLNPQAIGIMGFSAGGEVAALAGTHFDSGKSDADDPLERTSCRPDFLALVYPGIRIQQQPERYPMSAETPPTFLLHANNDPSGPERGTIPFYLALKKAGVPAELHIYADGRHGFGSAPEQPPARGPMADALSTMAGRPKIPGEGFVRHRQ